MREKIMSIVGARPNFTHLLVHTGQYYDRQMSELFLTESELAKKQAKSKSPYDDWREGGYSDDARYYVRKNYDSYRSRNPI